MVESIGKPVSEKQRNDEVDFIRMVVLIGICIVNVPFMVLPIDVPSLGGSYLDATRARLQDWRSTFVFLLLRR